MKKSKAKKQLIIEQTLTFQNKKYPYTLRPLGNGWTMVICDAANMEQEFLDEDIFNLIIDLPNLIIAEKEYRKKLNQMMRFRCNLEEKKEIEKRAAREHFPTVSSYLRALALGKA